MLTFILAATLEIGVYYTFPAETITLHNRTGAVQIEKQGLNIETNIQKMLIEAQNLVNKEAFGERKAVELKPKFIKYWRVENPSAYHDKNRLHAIDLDLVWSDFIALTAAKENKSDVSLLLFSSDVVHFNKELGRKTRASGFHRLDMIVLANYDLANPATRYSLTLNHEIGHYFNLNHTDAEECKKIYYVMCAAISSYNTVFDKTLKKAWRDFYFARTGQRFQPR